MWCQICQYLHLLFPFQRAETKTTEHKTQHNFALKPTTTKKPTWIQNHHKPNWPFKAVGALGIIVGKHMIYISDMVVWRGWLYWKHKHALCDHMVKSHLYWVSQKSTFTLSARRIPKTWGQMNSCNSCNSYVSLEDFLEFTSTQMFVAWGNAPFAAHVSYGPTLGSSSSHPCSKSCTHLLGKHRVQYLDIFILVALEVARQRDLSMQFGWITLW